MRGGARVACVVRRRRDARARCRHRRAAARANLENLRANPLVRDVRQAGTMIGIELREGFGRRIADALYDAGHFTRPIGDVIQFVPPLSSTDAEVDNSLRNFVRCIDQVNYLQRAKQTLAAIRGEGRYRELPEHGLINVIDFSSNDYLVGNGPASRRGPQTGDSRRVGRSAPARGAEPRARASRGRAGGMARPRTRVTFFFGLPGRRGHDSGAGRARRRDSLRPIQPCLV